MGAFETSEFKIIFCRGVYRNRVLLVMNLNSDTVVLSYTSVWTRFPFPYLVKGTQSPLLLWYFGYRSALIFSVGLRGFYMFLLHIRLLFASGATTPNGHSNCMRSPLFVNQVGLSKITRYIRCMPFCNHCHCSVYINCIRWSAFRSSFYQHILFVNWHLDCSLLYIIKKNIKKFKSDRHVNLKRHFLKYFLPACVVAPSPKPLYMI